MRTAVLVAAAIALAGCQSGSTSKQAAPAYKATGDLLTDSKTALETPVQQAELVDMSTDAIAACAANETRLMEHVSTYMRLASINPALKRDAVMVTLELDTQAELVYRVFTDELRARDADRANAVHEAAVAEARGMMEPALPAAVASGDLLPLQLISRQEVETNQKRRLAARGIG